MNWRPWRRPEVRSSQTIPIKSSRASWSSASGSGVTAKAGHLPQSKQQLAYGGRLGSALPVSRHRAARSMRSHAASPRHAIGRAALSHRGKPACDRHTRRTGVFDTVRHHRGTYRGSDDPAYLANTTVTLNGPTATQDDDAWMPRACCTFRYAPSTRIDHGPDVHPWLMAARHGTRAAGSTRDMRQAEEMTFTQTTAALSTTQEPRRFRDGRFHVSPDQRRPRSWKRCRRSHRQRSLSSLPG